MFNPKHLHNPDEFTLEMKVDVGRLRMEIILSQSAVDAGSEEPGTLRRSPAIGSGSDEPGVSRAQTSTGTEEISLLETSMDGFLHSNCTSPKQKCILLQPVVGVEDEKETITTTHKPLFARSSHETNEEAAATKDSTQAI